MPAVLLYVDDSNARPIRILLVHGDPSISEALTSLLHECGYIVSTAHDARSGFYEFLNHRPDLAILDLGLPMLDGFVLARMIRDASGDHPTRVVALGGARSPRFLQQSAPPAFDYLLLKPAKWHELQPVLCRCEQELAPS